MHERTLMMQATEYRFDVQHQAPCELIPGRLGPRSHGPRWRIRNIRALRHVWTLPVAMVTHAWNTDRKCDSDTRIRQNCPDSAPCLFPICHTFENGANIAHAQQLRTDGRVGRLLRRPHNCSAIYRSRHPAWGAIAILPDSPSVTSPTVAVAASPMRFPDRKRRSSNLQSGHSK